MLLQAAQTQRIVRGRDELDMGKGLCQARDEAHFPARVELRLHFVDENDPDGVLHLLPARHGLSVLALPGFEEAHDVAGERQDRTVAVAKILQRNRASHLLDEYALSAVPGLLEDPVSAVHLQK